MEEGLDTGPVLDGRVRSSIGRKNLWRLHDELAPVGADPDGTHARCAWSAEALAKRRKL